MKASDEIREREERRTDVTHEIDAPWISVRLVLDYGTDVGDATEAGVITEEGIAWLREKFFARYPGAVIRCNPSDPGTTPALYSYDPWKRERTGRLSIESAPPPPVVEAPDERTITIELSGPHEAADRGGWIFLAACAPWPEKADLTAVGPTPRAALDALGAELERHLVAAGWKVA